MKNLLLIPLLALAMCGCSLESVNKSKKEAQQEEYFFGEVAPLHLSITPDHDRILEGYALEQAYWIKEHKELPHGVFFGSGYEYYDVETDDYLNVVGYISVKPLEEFGETYKVQISNSKWYGAATYGKAIVLFLALETPEAVN